MALSFQGVKATVIAKECGVSLKTVYIHAGDNIRRHAAKEREARTKRNDLMFNKAQRGVPIQQIANEFYLDVSTVQAIIRTYDEAGFKLQRGRNWETVPTRKLELADAVFIIQSRGRIKTKELARQFGVTLGTIYDIWHKRTWKVAWDAYEKEVGSEK